MTYTELRALQKEAQRLWISGWWLLMETENCLRECNGCGAEWMPKWIRKFLDKFLRLFAPAIAIHDMRYYKHEENRDKWDDEFEVNCREILYDKYGFWNPMRWLGKLVIRQLRGALATLGGIAWDDAGKRFAEVE